MSPSAISDESQDDHPDHPSTPQKVPSPAATDQWRGLPQSLWILLLAISLRLFSAHFLADFFHQNPQFSTPWSSLKRFREGLFLYRHNSSGNNIYDGDLFHVLPLFLHLLGPSMDFPLLLRFQWTLFDLLTAYFVSRFVSNYIKNRCLAQFSDPDKAQECMEQSQWLGLLAFGGYLLNPMSIGCWTVCSLSSLVNVLISMSLCYSGEGHLFLSVLPLALTVQLNPYYLTLFLPIFIHFTGRPRIFAILLALSTSSAIFSLNIFLLGQNSPLSDLLRNTFGFFLTVPDLTPNTGIFWYFVTQVFDHYRQLFLCAFQLNTILYVVPLAALLRNSPSLLAVHLLLIVALFSPYPSYAESALYLPALAAFYDLHKYLRQRLIVGCALFAIFVLSPIKWSMWVITGSGNANFFFGIVLAFNLTQIFIAADLLSAYIREKIISNCGGDQEVERRFEGIRLITVSPF